MKYPLPAVLFLLAGCASAPTAKVSSTPANNPAPAANVSAASAAKMGKGQIQAAIVQGEVSLLSSDGKVHPLARGATFQDGYTVVCGNNGNTLLVFSNGATLKLTANMQLTIHQFDQADFDPAAAGGTFMRLTKDPSKSSTVLDLNNGKLGDLGLDVKSLNIAAGSTFVVNTPEGPVDVSKARLPLNNIDFTPHPITP